MKKKNEGWKKRKTLEKISIGSLAFKERKKFKKKTSDISPMLIFPQWNTPDNEYFYNN